MSRATRLRVIFACLAVGVAIFYANRDSEPYYQGYSLSQWLDRCGTDIRASRPPEVQTVFAIRAIGTNAIPFLLRWIRYEPPPWSETARAELPPAVRTNAIGYTIMYGRARTRAELAVIAFCFLGTNAAPAIPDLTRLEKDKTHRATSIYAGLALQGIGAPAQ